jgi:endonuclease/exonuclease/phosphatase family metal-dependent hydrolase
MPAISAANKPRLIPSFPLAAPEPGGHIARMPKRSSAILAALTLAFLLPARDRVGAADEITFVAYNLKNYLKMDRRVEGEFVKAAPKPETETAPLLRMIVGSKPDILGVCEIGSEVDAADLQTRLKAAGIDLPHLEYAHGSDSERRLALFSRFPIVARDSQESLTYQLGDRTFGYNRGILDATVEINPGYRLRLLGTHLKSKREVNEGDQAVMRRNEAELMRKHAESILAADPSTNLLLYGDFNDTRNETPIRVLQGRFGKPDYLADIQLEDKDGYRWTYCWDYADQYSRFDFIFVSPGLYPEVLREKSRIHSAPEWFAASDHRPLVVTISAEDKETK